MPHYAFCLSASWVDYWSERSFLEQDTAYVYSSCRIIDAGSPREVAHRHDWFWRKGTKFPSIFNQRPALGGCLDPTLFLFSTVPCQ